jgi:peptidoglycan/xylan/chitin deacetylase (PgdA/CDA1 family)
VKESAIGTVVVSTLLYHSVAVTSTANFSELTVEPGLFSEHLGALRDAGCRFIRFQDVPAILARHAALEAPPDRPVVAITIDDGLADVVTGAEPALRQQGIPATFFVPTAYVGGSARWLPGDDGNRPLCDWQTLRDLATSGWEIGSHGHRHIAADFSSPATVTADAGHSRSLLEDQIGTAVTSFAYPFGYHSRQGRLAIRTAGFRQAAIVAGMRSRSGDDPWRLPRIQIGPNVTGEDLVVLVTHKGGEARWRKAAKQQLWRFGRRSFAWGPPEATPVAQAPQDDGAKRV